MSIIEVMDEKFEILIELLIRNNSTTLGGNEKWIDWDAVYSDLLDEGYSGADASELLDHYMEENNFS